MAAAAAASRPIFAAASSSARRPAAAAVALELEFVPPPVLEGAALYEYKTAVYGICVDACAGDAQQVQQAANLKKSIDPIGKYIGALDTTAITARGWTLVSLDGDEHQCFWHVFRMAFLLHPAMAAHRDKPPIDFINVIKGHCLRIVEKYLVWPPPKKARSEQQRIVSMAVLGQITKHNGDKVKDKFKEYDNAFAEYRRIVQDQWGGLDEAVILSCGAAIPEAAHYAELQVLSHSWSGRTLDTMCAARARSLFVAHVSGTHYAIFARDVEGKPEGTHPFLIEQSESPQQMFRDLLVQCNRLSSVGDPRVSPGSGESTSSSVQDITEKKK